MMEGRPTAKEMGMDEEFVYATRIVDFIMKIDLNRDCERLDAIKAIERAFREYKKKITDESIGKTE